MRGGQMKIHCPACKTAYHIPDEKVSRPVITAVCKRCGIKMVIDRDAETVRTASETESLIPGHSANLELSPEISGHASSQPGSSETEVSQSPMSRPSDSVMGMAPEYSKHRDVLIIGVVIAIFIVILAGGYFLFGRTETAYRKITQNPIRYLTSLINGYETYKICEVYLRRNERLFRGLGPELRFSLVEEEIKVSKGEKTARLVVKAQGRSGKRNVLFQLNKQEGRWRIFYVGLERPDGTYEILYPKRKS